EQGGIAGPPLDGVADRLTEKALQEALLIPNQDVAEGFGEYSAMPPMGGLLNHRDLRDVIAYLKTLRADQ
ncbi:MAG: cytochrome c, partial [Phycisphaerales bacterium]|nr:cytochrome c [Phycisphaerales bacterium]